MKSKLLAEELIYANENKYAVGAFNIFNYLSAYAVICGAVDLHYPIILQTSVSTVKKYGPVELGTMLQRLAYNASVNVLVHLDHCQDLELAKACIDAGWDSVMYDGSRLPLENNIKNCREIVQYAHRKGVQVEGELGTIVGVEEDIQVKEGAASGAKLEESLYFVKESGIDVFAPAIGTAHGIYKGVPKIDFELIKQLNAIIDTPIVIHGGTGLSNKIFAKLIQCGASKINVSTALKQAYIGGCSEYINENSDKLDPLGLDQYICSKVKEAAKEYMVMFRQSM